MSISEDIAGLSNDLQKEPLNARTNIMAFPSGAVWLDIHYGGRLFNFAYLPSEKCFGVDEYIRERDGISSDFHFSFPDFESAKAKLLDLLDEAQATPARIQKSKALT